MLFYNPPKVWCAQLSIEMSGEDEALQVALFTSAPLICESLIHWNISCFYQWIDLVVNHELK